MLSEVYVTVTVDFLFAFVVPLSYSEASMACRHLFPRPAMRPSLLNLHLVHVSTE